MSYLELVHRLRESCIGKNVSDIDAERRAAADAICELLDKSGFDDALAQYLKQVIEHSAEDRAKKAEAKLEEIRRILYRPLIVADMDDPNKLIPIQNTSKQDVYTTVLKAQKAAGVLGRWFPEVWGNKDEL